MKSQQPIHNTTQQHYGNVIIIHPTPATMTPTTSESLSIDTSSAQEANPGEISKKQETDAAGLKPSSKASSLSNYFSRLFAIMKPKPAHLNNKKSSPVKNVAGEDTANWGWLHFRRRKTDKKKTQRFVWCFRPVAGTANGVTQTQSLFWTTFGKKNQLELTRQFDRFSHGAVFDSCKLQDRKIFGGKMVVTVMLKEAMAFVLDPEWSEPITYEIAWLPKLNWYQRMREMREYKRWIKWQHKQQQHYRHHQHHLQQKINI